MNKVISLIIVVLILAGCGKGGSNNPAPGGGGSNVPSPSAAVLSFPDQNSACTTGDIVSATQSSITFTWNVADNADSYDITIKNLLTSTLTTKNTTAAKLTITLLRNTPYSWSVISKGAKTSATAQSDTWKFYNSGPGTVTYAPFPADITYPSFGQSINTQAASINLTWKGSSVTNDISGYDVYFGTSATPPLLKSDISDSFLNAVSIAANKLYYWRVVTKDMLGNSSDSGVYQFKVN